jgi:hypothetical protein
VTTTRWWGLALSAFAIVLLAAPGTMARQVAGDGVPAPCWLVRVLGGRTLGQGLFIARAPGRSSLTVSAGADLLHLISMVAAALVWPRYRRTALAAALAGGVSAAVELKVLGSNSGPRS